MKLYATQLVLSDLYWKQLEILVRHFLLEIGIPLNIVSSSIGWDSIDLALAIHGYTGIVTYEVQNDGRTIDATVTIYDVMNFERRDDFPFGIRQLNQDGYLAEENDILHPFGFKTTVHLTIDPLHVILW